LLGDACAPLDAGESSSALTAGLDLSFAGETDTIGDKVTGACAATYDETILFGRTRAGAGSSAAGEASAAAATYDDTILFGRTRAGDASSAALDAGAAAARKGEAMRR